MFICLKCDQMYSVKPIKHGKARRPHAQTEYFSCDGKVVPAELLGTKGKRKKVQLVFKFCK